MYRVGEQLVVSAQRATDDDEARDLFARSAFNRYYYATFLIARSLVADLLPDQVGIGHKALPDLLQKKLLKKVTDQLDKATRAGLIHATQQKQIRSSTLTQISSLVNLLREAYPVRVVADYQPDTKINIGKDGGFELDSVSVNQARKWVKNATSHREGLLRIWRTIGGSI